MYPSLCLNDAETTQRGGDRYKDNLDGQLTIKVVQVVKLIQLIQVVQVVRMIRLDDMHSENKWFEWS